MVAGLWVSVSCFEEGDCLVTNSNIVVVDFRKVADKKAVQPVAISSVDVLGGVNLYRNQELSQLKLPVDPHLTETHFIIRQASKTDTLGFSYRNQSVVLAPDCGAYLYQFDLAVTRNTFGPDKVRIVNNALNTNIKSNVEVYF